MLSLESIFFNGHGVLKAVTPHKTPVQLSILPQNHMLEFTGGVVIQLYVGSHVVFANTLLPHEIMDRLKAFKYTDMIVVPLFLRSIRGALKREIGKSPAKKAYFAAAFALSRMIPVKAIRRKIFAPVISKFGGIERFICGGAALEYSTQQFFTLMGFTVTQGYGLTETAPVSTINYTADSTLGTQGRAIPGTEMKIDSESGEVLLRGPHIMKGYYKMPELTAQVITPEGWFKSGDIGRLDKKGNLFITGRLKELIVLGNGKKVFPDEVESIMQISDNIKEIIIVGAQEKTGPLKNTESVCAVVVPTDELLKNSDEPAIRDLIEKEIRKHAEKVAAYKRPSKIYLAYQELPKTNTRKNKRMLIKRMIEEGVFA
jgi:long-chain acyl-CoA synthetase